MTTFVLYYNKYTHNISYLNIQDNKDAIIYDNIEIEYIDFISFYKHSLYNTYEEVITFLKQSLHISNNLYKINKFPYDINNYIEIFDIISSISNTSRKKYDWNSFVSYVCKTYFNIKMCNISLSLRIILKLSSYYTSNKHIHTINDWIDKHNNRLSKYGMYNIIKSKYNTGSHNIHIIPSIFITLSNEYTSLLTPIDDKDYIHNKNTNIISSNTTILNFLKNINN